MMFDASLSSSFQPHWDRYPKVYVAPKIASPFKLLDYLDGDLSKDIWKNAQFSEDFDDIRGVKDCPDDHERPNKHCRTRFKAMYDDEHLYIGAILDSDFVTQAHFTQRNSPIFQRDSDFEVFVDFFGSNHQYKELEVNAINTVWNLMLNKPYDDGGEEYSARIAQPQEERYYEVYHQKTATKVLNGTLNDPTGSGATWSVEVALAFTDLRAHTAARTGSSSSAFSASPRVGSTMRINFSRVEKQGAINWTWQPQIVWDPIQHRYAGKVAMHLPDAWGYIVFGGDSSTKTNNIKRTTSSSIGSSSSALSALDPMDDNDDETGTLVESRELVRSAHSSSKMISTETTNTTTALPPFKDLSFPGRLAAMNIYYAQEAFANHYNNGTYATSIDELTDLLDEEIITPFDIRIHPTNKTGGGGSGGYYATVSGNPDGSTVRIANDRLLQVIA